MKKRRENGEIMICCVILIFIIFLFVFMMLICVVSASQLNSVERKELHEEVVMSGTPGFIKNAEVVQKKDSGDKIPRGEVLAIISGLISTASGIAAAAVVPGKLLRVLLVIIFFSLSASLFFW